MKKKIIKTLIATYTLTSLLSGCGSNNEIQTEEVLNSQEVVNEEYAEGKITASEGESPAVEETITKEEYEKALLEEAMKLQEQEANEYYEKGRQYLYGLDGNEMDIDAAGTNFQKARELGKTDASFYLGLINDWYYEGNIDESKKYYEECKDNYYAQINLNLLYREDFWKNEDNAEVKEALQSLADQGIVEANMAIGLVADYEGDYATAVEYYNKALESTEQFYLAAANNYLGSLYFRGSGVDEDRNKAFELQNKAADLGNGMAILNVGEMYEYGIVVESDAVKALELYEKSAKLGTRDAMNCLGMVYLEGTIVEQDYLKAVEW